MIYLYNYWPCARYVDNVAKVFNELCFVGMLMSCAFMEEMSGSIGNLSLSSDRSASLTSVAPMMNIVLFGNVIFHCIRLAHNSVQAAKTIKARRQQIATKWLGPPVSNDAEYPPDTSSGEEEPLPEDGPNADDSPNLVTPNLLFPACEPDVDKHGKLNKRDYRSVFPKKFVAEALPSRDGSIPEKVLEPEPKSKGATVIDDGDLTEIEDVPFDFDVPLPKVPTFGFPNEFAFDENSLPEGDCLDMAPDQPGKENEMGFDMP